MIFLYLNVSLKDMMLLQCPGHGKKLGTLTPYPD